jgi:hypothetical protein
MPGNEQCVACSATLAGGQARESVMPPRARDRTVRDRVRWALQDSSVVAGLRSAREGASALGDRLRGGLAASRDIPRWSLNAEVLRASWDWINRRTWWRILLSALPGYGPACVAGRNRMGAAFFAGALASLALTACCYRHPVSNVLLFVVVALSMVSVGVAMDFLRGRREELEHLLLARIGIALIVVSLYFGTYAGLRIALEPVASIVSVVQVPPGIPLHSGDSLLVLGGEVRRGDLVLSTIRYHGVQVPSVGRLIGMPGDRLVLSDRLYVNRRPVAVALPQLGAPYDQQRPYSANEAAARTLGPDEYWIVPNYNAAPGTREVLDTGVMRRNDIRGRIAAVVAPAQRRRIIPRDENDEPRP